MRPAQIAREICPPARPKMLYALASMRPAQIAREIERIAEVAPAITALQ